LKLKSLSAFNYGTKVEKDSREFVEKEFGTISINSARCGAAITMDKKINRWVSYTQHNNKKQKGPEQSLFSYELTIDCTGCQEWRRNEIRSDAGRL
jgi:hypothetical protein